MNKNADPCESCKEKDLSKWPYCSCNGGWGICKKKLDYEESLHTKVEEA